MVCSGVPPVADEPTEVRPADPVDRPRRGIFPRVRGKHLFDIGQVDYRLRSKFFGKEHGVIVSGETGFPAGGNEHAAVEFNSGARIDHHRIGAQVVKDGSDQLCIEPCRCDAYPVLLSLIRRYSDVPIRFLVGPRRPAAADYEDEPSIPALIQKLPDQKLQLFHEGDVHILWRDNGSTEGDDFEHGYLCCHSTGEPSRHQLAMASRCCSALRVLVYLTGGGQNE